jgi:hypothetical protein
VTLRPLAILALVALMNACAADAPPSASDPAPSGTTPPRAGAIVLPEPGHPFDAAAMLAALRDSRRPGGVPDELETDAIASALSNAIWTLDGEPWNAVSAGGSCGPATCTLEIAGAGEGAQADDLWVFEVAPATGAVQIQTTDLRSLPTHLAASLDQLTRSLVPVAELDGLILTNVRWLPPPDEGQFVVSYRSGGEEGSCGVDVTVDAAVPEIVSGSSSDC